MTLTGLNIVALALSIVLSWHFLRGEAIPGCDGSGGCGQVLSSKWSVIAGKIPVSGLALGTYLSMLIAGFYIGPATEHSTRTLAWNVLTLFAGSIVGMAAWFIALQKLEIGEFCPYCMATHGAGLIMAGLIVWQAALKARTEVDRPIYRTARLACLGFSIAGFLALVQVTSMPDAAYREGASEEKMPELAYDAVPLIGSPNAPYIVKVLFDYQCPHCQKVHVLLRQAVDRYAGKLAFALCPTPLNSACNPYVPRDIDAFKNSCELAKISLAVWVASPREFASFDDWMFADDHNQKWRSRTPEAARAKAIALVGETQFAAGSNSGRVEDYLQTCTQIYGLASRGGQGGVPKLIFGSRWVVPEPENADGLIRILQQSLGVPEP